MKEKQLTPSVKLTPIEQLRLGDVVRFPGNSGAFMSMVVVRKSKSFLRLFRVFVHLGDFEHSGGVTPYTGTENVDYNLPSDAEFEVLTNIYRHG